MDLLTDLNEPQRQAVTHVDGPLLVLAGAGSGKTRVITRRVAYLVQQGIAPWNVLAITFTNKAAGEMKERVDALGVPRGATVATFHSLCARLLREYAPQAGLPGNFSIYDRDDQIKVIKQALENLELPKENLQPSRVHAMISNAKNELRSPDAFARQDLDFFGKRVALVYREYDKLLRQNQALDFDDLLIRTVGLLSDEEVRRRLGRRYQYILIDEYQDTNRAQYVLAHGIAMEHSNICATGDPDQSIYAWRGANIHNILDFEKDYPGATVVRLEENYRSTQPILSAASRLIAHNTQRKKKDLWTQRPGGSDVRVIFCDSEHDEAAEIVRRIVEYRNSGGALGDVAVFYRLNSLSRVLETAFVQAGIAYAIARGTEFYNRKEIKDVLAYLRVLVNPADDVSCERIINVPPRGIGAATVGRLRSHAAMRGGGLLAAARDAEGAGLGAGAAKKVREFGDMIVSMAVTLTGRVREIVEEVIRRSGLEESHAAKDEDSQQARANVQELVSAAAEFDRANPTGALADFLHQISLVSDADHMEGSTGSVTMMTLHAAKGLEFPCVFVVGLEQGVLPMSRLDNFGQIDDKELEEERRLAFVGMTRAMRELTLTSARTRMMRGQTMHQEASPFLRELGREGVTLLEAGASAVRRRPGFGGRGGFYEGGRGERIRREIERGAFGGRNAWGERDEFAERDEFNENMELATRRQASEPGAYDDFVANIERRLAADDFDAADAPVPVEYEYLRVGGRVRHSSFGDGKVLAISQPWPETRVKISFNECGVKTLVLSKTKLEVL